jgi:hypothetical protein
MGFKSWWDAWNKKYYRRNTFWLKWFFGHGLIRTIPQARQQRKFEEYLNEELRLEAEWCEREKQRYENGYYENL